jgi:hypothetical protein
MFHASLVAATCVAIPIFTIPTAWVILFRRGKADGYAEDFFDHLLNREGFSFSPDNQSPLGAGKKRTVSSHDHAQ